MSRARIGLEILVEQKLDMVRGLRVGLVCNQSAVNAQLVHAADVLRINGVQVVALFAPEHGIRGDIPPGVEVPSGTDPRTDIPIHSLYGKNRKPTREMLAGIDAVLLDIQDIGCRFYTYIYTMSFVLQACGQLGKPVIVLDRPNPLSGTVVEGNIPEREFASFVGLHPIPIRHGMTMGELALFFSQEYHMGARVEVVTCTGWRRPMWWDETSLPWVMPSPNIPAPDAALVYPGTCLLEGTNVSEGRGTSKPFELLGAPWVDAHSLSDRLNDVQLPGVRFRPAFFAPTTSKHSGRQCGGVQVHVMDRRTFEPVRTGLVVTKVLREMYPSEFAFLPAGSSGKLFFDLLAGTDRLRKGLEAGLSVDELIHTWYYDLQEFMGSRRKYLLYL